VYRFGFIEGRNEKASSSKITAETVEEAKAGVEFFFKRHYDGIKIYNSVKPELVPVIAAAAHAHGMKVTGHIPVHMLAHEAVEAGYDGIEHVNMLFLNFFATHDTDTRDTTRFTLVGDKAGDFDLNSKQVRDFFKLLRDHKTVLDPTVGAFEDLFVGEQGKVIPGLESMVDRLPIQSRRSFLVGGLPLDADKRTHYLAAFDKLLAMVKAIHDAKLHLVIGTDNLGGLYLDHELELYVRAKIPVADVLRIATLDSARELGIDAKTGSIAKGKLADMFVVDGDPLADIKSISHVVSTMKGGAVYRIDALLHAVSVAPAK
jgi:imidazolonepropionase-like amidohydrolase